MQQTVENGKGKHFLMGKVLSLNYVEEYTEERDIMYGRFGMSY